MQMSCLNYNIFFAVKVIFSITVKSKVEDRMFCEVTHYVHVVLARCYLILLSWLINFPCDLHLKLYLPILAEQLQ